MRIKKSLLILVWMSSVLPIFAWDSTGHKLTAYIAWEHMTQQARENAFKILLSAPEDSDLSVFYLPFDSRSEAVKKREFFMFASTWADIIKDRKFENRYRKYNKSNWHYSDTFWRNVNGKMEVISEAPEDGGKAVEQLAASTEMLRSTTATNAEKAIALAWVLHLGGDLHQPLHTSARVTDLEPKGDQGGNLFYLGPQPTTGWRPNLHSYWDGIIERKIPRKNDASDAEYLPAIAKKIMRKYTFEKMQNRLALAQFATWQQESFALNATKVFSETLKRDEMPSPRYLKQVYQTSLEQIALAGYRMGALLNQVLDS